MTGNATTDSGRRSGSPTGHGSGPASGHGPATTAATPQVNPAIPPVAVAVQLAVPEAVPASGQISGLASGRMAADWPPRWPRPAATRPDTIETASGWLGREIETGEAAASVAVPLLGSPKWAALPDGEAAKWAAVFRAARAWLGQYAAIGEHVRREAAEELARFEQYATERDRAHYAPLRQAATEAAAAIERRERAAARTDLPNQTGPELIAAAYASWGLTPPPTEPCHDPRALEVV